MAKAAPLPRVASGPRRFAHLPEQEAQGGQILTDRGEDASSLGTGMSLIPPNLLRPKELVRRLVKNTRKVTGLSVAS